jgi:hypothetical protein
MNLDMPCYAHETTADYLLPGFPPAATRVVADYGTSSARLPGPLWGCRGSVKRCGSLDGMNGCAGLTPPVATNRPADAVALRIEDDHFA